MRIALAHSFLTSRGGGERFVLEAAKEWGKRHEVTVHTWEYLPESTFPEFESLGVKIIPHRRGITPFSKLVSWSSIRLHADVVSAHGFPAHFTSFCHPHVVYYLHIIPGFARLHHSRNPLMRAYAGTVAAIDRRASHRCREIIANSKLTSQWARVAYHRRAPVIHPGIHPREFHAKSYGEFALCVSRLVPEKRVLELVREWNPHSSGGLKLVIVGMGERQFVSQLEREARGKDVEILSSGISDHRLKELYSTCQCVVLPAHHEPFGIVLLEGMASGKPVIAHASGGPLEIVSPGTGFLVPNDRSMLAAVRWLAGEKQLAQRMGKLAIKRAAHFAWEKQLAKLESVLHRASDWKG